MFTTNHANSRRQKQVMSWCYGLNRLTHIRKRKRDTRKDRKTKRNQCQLNVRSELEECATIALSQLKVRNCSWYCPHYYCYHFCELHCRDVKIMTSYLFLSIELFSMAPAANGPLGPHISSPLSIPLSNRQSQLLSFFIQSMHKMPLFQALLSLELEEVEETSTRTWVRSNISF